MSNTIELPEEQQNRLGDFVVELVKQAYERGFSEDETEYIYNHAMQLLADHDFELPTLDSLTKQADAAGETGSWLNSLGDFWSGLGTKNQRRILGGTAGGLGGLLTGGWRGGLVGAGLGTAGAEAWNRWGHDWWKGLGQNEPENPNDPTAGGVPGA